MGWGGQGPSGGVAACRLMRRQLWQVGVLSDNPAGRPPPALTHPPAAPCLQCKPDPLVLERTNKMLLEKREELAKAGVRPGRGGAGQRGEGSGWRGAAGRSTLLQHAAAHWHRQARAIARLPCLGQIKNVKLTTLVSCVGGANDIGRHISEYAESNKVLALRAAAAAALAEACEGNMLRGELSPLALRGLGMGH